MGIMKKQFGVILVYAIFVMLLTSAECIAENKALLFVGNDSYPPISYQEGGNPKGLAIDIVRALGQRMGRQIDIRLMEWKVAQAMVAQGKADALCQLTITEPRKKIYDFSDQAHDLRFSIFVRTGKQGINDLTDLRGLQVAVITASVQHQYVMADSQIKYTLTSNDLQGFQLLKDGKVDAVLADLWAGSYVLTEKMITGIQTSGEPFAHLASALAVKKGNTALMAAINDGLRSLQADGTIERINEKWSPKEVIFQTREQAVQKTYSFIIGILGLLLVVGAFWLITLRRKISERKLAEEALRKSEANYRQLFDNSPTGIYQVDFRTGKFTKVNDIMCEYLGCSQEKITSLISYDFLTDESKQLYSERLSKLISGEKVPENPEYEILDKNGRRSWIQFNSKYIYDSEGRLAGADVVAHNITDRKRAEEALRESGAHYRSLVEGIPCIVYTFSQKRGGVYYSSQVNNILGYSPEQLCANPQLWHNSIHPDDLTFIEQVIRETATGKPFCVEYRIRDAHGNWHWLEDRSFGYKVEDDDTIIEGLAFDITARKREEQEKAKLEDQLRQAQKMEAIGTLAGGIAHDFNNILAVIIGYTELARDRSQKEDNEQYLKETLIGAERARNLVKQILTFSRQNDYEKKPLDIKVLLKEAIKFLRASIPSTIEIDQQITGEYCNIMADPTQMHQVIMNLCTNASHAMKETGGTMKIDLANIELGKDEIPNHPELEQGHYVKLSVSDTGYGIDHNNIQKIFDPFFTTKSKDEGTGLGLSVVYGIVKGHGGVITVYSQPGKGAAFHVYLPLIIPTETKEVDAGKPVIGGTERILFVDDEPALVDIGMRMLFSMGYHVTGAASSQEALDMFRAEPQSFDLVITDMTLPKMTGIDLSREMLKIRPDIPIILCSGIREASIEAQVKIIGIKAYLTKPLTRRELSGVIREVLDGKEKKEKG